MSCVPVPPAAAAGRAAGRMPLSAGHRGHARTGQRRPARGRAHREPALGDANTHRSRRGGSGTRARARRRPRCGGALALGHGRQPGGGAAGTPHPSCGGRNRGCALAARRRRHQSGVLPRPRRGGLRAGNGRARVAGGPAGGGNHSRPGGQGAGGHGCASGLRAGGAGPPGGRAAVAGACTWSRAGPLDTRGAPPRVAAATGENGWILHVDRHLARHSDLAERLRRAKRP